MERCLGCMAEVPEGEEICRHCGYQKGTDVKEAYYLLPGKIVGEKYLIGRVLGYGGFGVTYIGWDTTLNRKVAVKEYLPSDFATRSYGTELLTVFSGEATVQFEAGLNSFISEAKRLAKFNRIPEIVDIYDCFMENGTGYIIMEFLEGVTVKELLKEQERIPVEEARRIAMAVLRGLSEVHKEGIIHRDIAPDNIFINQKGEVKLLDFGAARYATAVQSRSLSVVLKPGYAPEEQYRSRGEQGPWTDVYAMGATFYRMITGIRPDEAIERMVEDNLKPPSALGIAIEPNTEAALMNSLNVRKEFRTKDAETFYRELGSDEKVERIQEEKMVKEDLKLPLWMRWGAAAAGVLVCLCVGLLATGKISFTKKQIDSAGGAEALKEGECYVPNVSGMSYEEAKKALQEKNLTVLINGMNYSESIEKNKILSQTPKDGEKTTAEETVYVIMSGGSQEVMMPDLSGMEYEEAKELIMAQNLVLEKDGVTEEYNDFVEKGRIISQNIDPEERIKVQTKITLTVSLGSLSTETAILTVPDVRGMTKDEALACLAQLKESTGFTYSLGKVKKEFSDEVEKGKIISQGLEPGSEARTNEPLTLVISKGPQMVQVPEVVYLSKEEAVKNLEEAGLTVQVQEEYSSKVSKGLVISQSQGADTKVGKGTAITITVSLGEQPAKTDSDNSSSNTNKAPSQTKPQTQQQEPQAPEPEPPAPQPEQPAPQPEPPAPEPEPQVPLSDNGGVVEDNGGVVEDNGGVVEDDNNNVVAD